MVITGLPLNVVSSSGEKKAISPLVPTVTIPERIADGGAAMMAYAHLQQVELEPDEREALCQALLRYCELDTLVMVIEAWRQAMA